jgi:hypothetical protein
MTQTDRKTPKTPDRRHGWKKALILGSCLLFLNVAPVAFAQPPSLSLKDAIPVAEKSLQSAGIDASLYYLYSITLTGSSRGSFWYFTYRLLLAPSEYGSVFVKVYMNGTSDIEGGGSGRRYR